MSRPFNIEPRSSDDFGTRLRIRRESYGLSLSDVSDLTHIQPTYLAAIEALDEAALPAIGYTIGFVRTYATALGLDGDMAVKDYKADRALTPHMKLRDAPHVILRRQLRLPRGSVSAISVASVALCIGLWYGTQSTAIATPAPLVDIAPQYTAAAPVTPLSRIFVKGETWQGSRAAGYSVSVRDAGAVELYDGAELIGALGARGQPVTALKLTRDLPSEDGL